MGVEEKLPSNGDAGGGDSYESPMTMTGVANGFRLSWMMNIFHWLGTNGPIKKY